MGGERSNDSIDMYDLIAQHPAVWVVVDGQDIFLVRNLPKGGMSIYPCSLDGILGKELALQHREYIWPIDFFQGLWLAYYDEDTPLGNMLNIFSQDGELLQTISGEGYYYTLALNEGRQIYFVNRRRLLSYDLSTNTYRDLDPPQLKSPSYYMGSHRGLHFFTSQGKSLLVAMRDKDGQGLEEVYRLDFAESDRCKPSYSRNVEPGQVYFINFYDSDLWVSTYERVYRIDIATGQKLGTLEDEFLPKMSHHGGIGYAIYAGFYTVMDFENRRLLSCRLLDKFTHEGKEYSAEYTGLLLHEGIFYVSVRVSGIFFLAAFDVQTEKFIWHDLWGGWDIDSVHIVGDRMIAHSHDEVRIYQRAGRLTHLAKKLRGALLRFISPLTSDR